MKRINGNCCCTHKLMQIKKWSVKGLVISSTLSILVLFIRTIISALRISRSLDPKKAGFMKPKPAFAHVWSFPSESVQYALYVATGNLSLALSVPLLIQISRAHPYIFPSFPSFHPSFLPSLCVSQALLPLSMDQLSPMAKHRATARCEVSVSICIAYIYVSKFTPLAVTGPHGQLASLLFPAT